MPQALLFRCQLCGNSSVRGCCWLDWLVSVLVRAVRVGHTLLAAVVGEATCRVRHALVLSGLCNGGCLMSAAACLCYAASHAGLYCCWLLR
jgi:hypothetical protein